MRVIRAGQLIDGTGAAPRHDMAVIIDGERIAAVSPWAAANLSPDAEVLDARDATVLPGLIDAHTHIYAPGRDLKAFAMGVARDSYLTMALHAFANARKMLSYGYTTLRDVHALGYVDIAVRDAINAGVVEGPRLKVSGQGLCITGGHMDRTGFAPQISVWGQVGAVQPGCYADLLICDADLLQDIHVLTRHEHFRAVLKGGQLVGGTLLARLPVAV